MDGRRITAGEAIDLLDKHRGSLASEAICKRANDGVITARARLLILDKERHEDADVPAKFWWARGGDALEQNWDAGDFETWKNHTYHWRAYGVTFLESDILAMLPAPKTSELSPTRATSRNFAPVSSCVRELCGSTGLDPELVVKAIVRHCAARMINARCNSMEWSVTNRYGNEPHEDHGVLVPGWFWDLCAASPEPILDWQSGCFAANGLVNDDQCRARVMGIELDGPGIVKLETMLLEQRAAGPAETHAPPTVSDESLGSFKGKARSNKWDAWIAELASYIHEHGIPPGSGAHGQDELINAIDARLIQRKLQGPGRTTVQSAARAVLLRLRSAEN